MFAKCSGDERRLLKLLEGGEVTLWTPLEDMALTEPDTSLEFQVLLQEKGWQEIVSRRNFLKAKPIFDQEISVD